MTRTVSRSGNSAWNSRVDATSGSDDTTMFSSELSRGMPTAANPAATSTIEYSASTSRRRRTTAANTGTSRISSLWSTSATV